MAFTEEDKQELLNAIKAESQSIEDLETASSLTGVNSLPAMQGSKVVQVPISLLSQPADDAAALAVAAAKKAEDAAKDAAAETVKVQETIPQMTAAIADARDATAAARDVVTEFGSIAQNVIGTESLFNVNARCGDATYTLETALRALAAQETNDGVTYRKKGLVITYRIDTAKWETRQFIGASLDNWEDDTLWKGFGSGSGAGNVYNVTALHPLENDYYTLQTALEAVEREKAQARGLVVTFAISDSEWKSYQFIGSTLDGWNDTAQWREFGSGVRSVTVNGGDAIEPDSNGRVDIPIPTVDETLDLASTNPVQNSAVTAKLQEVESGTVFGMNAELSDDESSVRLSLTNKSGAEIASVDLPAGGGGGGGETSTTKVVLNATVDRSVIKEGDSAQLTYTYDHQYTSGDDAGTSTGQKAEIEVRILRGSVQLYHHTTQEVSKGSYTFDLTPYLQPGVTDVYVRATTTDPESGRKQSRQSYVSVRVVTLSLSSSYDLATRLSAGGYGDNDTATIPFAVNGSGMKVVTLYVDGVQTDTRTVSKSGITNGSFSIAMSSLLAGRHTVQLVAESVIDEQTTLRSESIYLDLLRSGGSSPFIGTMHRFADGRIFTGDHLTPRLTVGQYEQLTFDFVAYDPDRTPAVVTVYRDDQATQTVSVPRTTQTYTNRFQTQGDLSLRLQCNDVEYELPVSVTASTLDIEEATAGLRLKLSAAGRSNSEENPAQWDYGDIRTSFEGFDWSSNGWTGDALRLTNGAKIDIGYRPFATDATTAGATYEMELNCTNISDRDGIVVDCMTDGVGFQLTSQQALLRASGGSEVDKLFTSGPNMKIAFVVSRKADTRMLEFYVNGSLCGARQYAATESMLQVEPSTIRIGSDSADVELRNLRIYDRALTGDELLSNFFVDRPTGDEMVLLFEQNDVMNDEGTQVDIEKLRAQGKGVMRIVGDVDLVNLTNNKKFEIPVDVYYYSPYGKEYDFIARNIGLRIQGTSSTTYPCKNYRLYFARSEKYGTTLEVNGVDVPDLTYAFKPGARPVSIFCLKADYVDHFGALNTGGVRIVNDTFRKCGWLTPPQAAYKGQYDVRIGIDGFPIDLFYDNDGSGTNIYLGKYNFNNEKSGSHQVYGFEGIEGFNDEAALGEGRNKCICLEFLNNSEALCLFGTSDMARFDEALEFRFKPDTTWADAHEDDKAAVQRLWSWVQSCKGDPAKFYAEYDQYFGNDSPFAWYLVTDYFMGVDNRAKNMMLATWDGKIWYFLPYDLDTLFGKRNDGVQKYLYTITHETFDESIGSYAFAGHDSVLWELVRGCPDKLREVAEQLRSAMPTEYVLEVLKQQQMDNWCERIYNKDAYYKYIRPLLEGVATADGTTHYDYLYMIQGKNYPFLAYMVQNRFALLDAQYVCGTYRKDSFPAYFGYRFSLDPRKIRITASERFYFGYGYTSGTPKQAAVLAEDAGSTVELTLDSDLIVNDPQYVYGASRMRELDLSDVSHALLQTLNLNACTALRSLDISCAATQQTLNALLVNGCRNLRSLDMSGMQSAGFSSVDLSSNGKLELFRASRSALTGVTFAAGAPLHTVVLPATLQTLELRHLNRLTDEGLTLEGTSAILRLVIDGCALIDWQELLAHCPAVRYLRVTDVDIEDDGSLLRSLASMGGVDEQGGNTPTCRLVGRCRLTRYVDDAEFAAMQAHFPELTIEQPEWTCIEFDDAVSDPANISNLDNRTGYRFDTPYVPSGHVVRILAQRHRCLGKKTAEGVMTICPLHDADSNYYADAEDPALATPARLTGEEGDVFMYEPEYWYKGVNDLLNQKKYAFFSSNAECPTVDGQYVKLTKEQIEVVEGKAIRIAEEYTTLDEAVAAITTNSYCTVTVAGYRQVRFPAIASAVYGAVWLDTAGTILGRLRATSSAGALNGMYLFAPVPEGAERLAFTIATAADFDYVLLTTSDKIEAIEPDWVDGDEYLCAVYEALLQDDVLKSVSGIISTSSVPQDDMKVYASNRGSGFQLIDWDMHCAVANLSYAKYGTRNSQGQCGAGQSSSNKRSGLTNMLGMRDTINPENNPTGAYYYDGETLKDILSTNVMGYECWQGNKSEWMDGVMFNKEKSNGRWSIETPGRPAREVLGATSFGDNWAANMVFGRHMDLIIARSGGSETSHYCDWQGLAASVGRVVCRSYSSANAYGGVSFADTYYTALSTNANIGSRLAFRGRIVIEPDPKKFKEIIAIP